MKTLCTTLIAGDQNDQNDEEAPKKRVQGKVGRSMGQSRRKEAHWEQNIQMTIYIFDFNKLHHALH